MTQEEMTDAVLRFVGPHHDPLTTETTWHKIEGRQCPKCSKESLEFPNHPRVGATHGIVRCTSEGCDFTAPIVVYVCDQIDSKPADPAPGT